MKKQLIIFLYAVVYLSSSCSSETKSSNLCGNSLIDMNEECDSENLDNQSCNSLGFYEGTLGCKSNCTFDTSNCEKKCGDNQLDPLHEECDGEQIGNSSCADEGFYSGSVICTDECQLDYSGCSGFCGDNELQPEFEPCDGALTGDNMTCGKAGYFSGVVSCSEECTRKTDNCIYHLLPDSTYGKRQQESKISVDSNNNLLASSIIYMPNFEGGGQHASIKLQKLSYTGNVDWTEFFQHSDDSQIFPMNQALDSLGNIYITGRTQGCFTDTECTNTYDPDIFLLKVSNDGSRLWTRQLNSIESDYDYGKAVAVDTEDNIYLAACSPGTFSTYESLSSSDLYLFKYDSSGNQLWVKQYGTENSEEAKSVVLDQDNNIYLLSQITVDTLYHYARIYKIDSAGEVVWSITIPEELEGTNLTIYNSQIYLVGATNEALDTNEFFGTKDAFLIVMDLDGERLWSKTWGSPDYDAAADLAINSAGEIYITGGSRGTFNGSQHNGQNDIFILKTDSSGNLLWSKNWGNSGNDYGSSLAINQNDTIHFAGIFEEELFDQGPFDNASLVLFRFPSTHDFSN
ncbi:MAG: SBBP repeat-containing protein [Myxococcota bacterium]